MKMTKDISTIQKLHFILFNKGIVWTYGRLDTTWNTINKIIAADKLEESDAMLIEKVFNELYPDGVIDLDYYIKLVSLIALEDKTSIAYKIGISMYKMGVRLKECNWKEKEILMIEKVYKDYFKDKVLF